MIPNGAGQRAQTGLVQVAPSCYASTALNPSARLSNPPAGGAGVSELLKSKLAANSNDLGNILSRLSNFRDVLIGPLPSGPQGSTPQAYAAGGDYLAYFSEVDKAQETIQYLYEVLGQLERSVVG